MLLLLLALLWPGRAGGAVNLELESVGTPDAPVVVLWAHSGEAGPARLRLDLAPPLRLVALLWPEPAGQCQVKEASPQWVTCDYTAPASGAVRVVALLEADGSTPCAGGASVVAHVAAGAAQGLARVWVRLPRRSCVYLPIVVGVQ